MLPEQQYLSQCPQCAAQIDVTALEPYAKITCPQCRQSVRVRRKFDHFVIIKQIGEGGMSRVFEAEDESLGRRVALKILNRTYSRDAARMAQFQQEALITARVTHPNVIKLYSVGFDQGHFFIAMELVTGGSLEARIKRDGIVPEKDALRISRQVAEGLRAAYKMGLLHRDVKPANILFTDEGVAKVVDFGLALFVDRKDETGEIWATPFYVSPEKVIENHEDFRSDLFSLGATLYHALTGKPPHKANTNSIQELRMIKCHRVALEEAGGEFAPRTIHIVDKLTAFSPSDRPSSYDETVDQLRLAEALTERTIMSRLSWRRKLVIGTAAALALAFAVGWLVRNLSGPQGGTYTSTTSLKQDDLAGDGRTVTAGQRTPAERYLEARRIFSQGNWAEAGKRFHNVIEERPAQPTLNRARLHAAICALVAGKKGQAQKLFIDLRDDVSAEATAPVAPDLRAFYTQIGKTMADNLGLDSYAATLSYPLNTEAAAGWLVHGMAQWYFGSIAQARACFLKFDQSRQTDAALAWLEEYHALIAPYLADSELVASLAQPAKEMSESELRTLLAAARKARGQVKTTGPVPDWLDKQIGKLNDDLAARRKAALAIDLQAQAKHRREELQQFAEMNRVLPSLARGYDYRPAVEMLGDLQYESPEVKGALESRLYLYRGSVEFMQRLFADIGKRPWSGRVQRRDSTPIDGRVTAASYSDMTITLARGALTVPLEQVAPETLISIAQDQCATVSDSTEYYLRQEEIARFARVQGLTTVSSNVAAQLMDENRGFRSRWLALLQSGG